MKALRFAPVVAVELDMLFADRDLIECDCGNLYRAGDEGTLSVQESDYLWPDMLSVDCCATCALPLIDEAREASWRDYQEYMQDRADELHGEGAYADYAAD